MLTDDIKDILTIMTFEKESIEYNRELSIMSDQEILAKIAEFVMSDRIKLQLQVHFLEQTIESFAKDLKNKTDELTDINSRLNLYEKVFPKPKIEIALENSTENV